MQHYKVFEACVQRAEIGLQDGGGACHVARPTGTLPSVGSDLRGPDMGGTCDGAATLYCAVTGRRFHMIFVLVNCDRQATIERLHPQVTCAGVPRAAFAARPKPPRRAVAAPPETCESLPHAGRAPALQGVIRP